MSFLNFYIPDVAMITWLYVSIIFLFALIRKDNSVMDVFWGLGFIVIALYAIIQSGVIDLRKIIVTILVSLWGLRLSVYIYLRNRNKGEDFRYAEWRRRWKFFYLRSYLQVFLLQGFLMLVVSSPVWFINFNTGGTLGIWDFLGLVFFGSGFFIESLADQQLTEHKRNPVNKGRLLTTGLWSVSRHPNYFGEALIWWGIAFYAYSIPGGWITVAGPITMTLLLRYVSGVPLLENRMEKFPEWVAYKRQTAPFIPFVHWF